MTRNPKHDVSKKRSPEAVRLRKETVLDAAAIEFAAKGYADADMDRIAATASVGKGTIYRYYHSKEELFEAVADEAINRLWDFVFSSLQKAESRGSIEQLKAVGKSFLAFFDGNQRLVEIFLRGGSQFRERMHVRYLQTYEENIHIIQDMLDRCIEQGIIKRIDSRQVIDIAGDMLIGLVYMWGARRDKRPLTEQWTLVEQIILEGILV